MSDDWRPFDWNAQTDQFGGLEPAAEGGRPRRRTLALSAVAVTLVIALAGVGVVLLTGNDDPQPVAASGPTTAATVEAPTSPATVAEPSPSVTSPSARPSVTTTSPKPKVSIAPSKRVVQDTPPVIVTKPPKTADCPTYPGPTSTKAQVRAELEQAAAHQFWGSVKEIKVPLTLLKAVAWQESGWQSSIVACDWGIGTMQVMPDTVTMVNNRFGTSWNVNTVSGNIMLGGNYLAWLIKYMGDAFYSTAPTLTARYDVLGNEGLLNSVIAAYNDGFGHVDPTLGTAGIRVWPYVNNVRALIVSCPCSAY